MIVEPISGNSQRILGTATHVVLGISPFNSYYSEERIRELAEWGCDNLAAAHLFVPDVPTTYTLRALGYSEKKATKKARRQANYLINKIQRALAAMGIDDGTAATMLLTWDTLSANPRYQALLDEANDAYRTDAEFQHDCRSEVIRVLKGRLEPSQALTPQNLDLAAQYFLCEMPLFVDTPAILEQPASVFAYRECGPLLRKLYDGEYRYSVSDRQGFAVLTCSLDDGIDAEMAQGMFI